MILVVPGIDLDLKGGIIPKMLLGLKGDLILENGMCLKYFQNRHRSEGGGKDNPIPGKPPSPTRPRGDGLERKEIPLESLSTMVVTPARLRATTSSSVAIHRWALERASCGGVALASQAQRKHELAEDGV